ncbi:hypothetical protein [Natrinema sp. J7-1]|uniref:hypothetical protein n=1 Tax=Natrinema sp. J7-1 TaxID=1172566 RepID=UPI00067790DB|nr:hypothetical protein [Natrinema sp. J7-1]
MEPLPKAAGGLVDTDSPSIRGRNGRPRSHIASRLENKGRQGWVAVDEAARFERRLPRREQLLARDCSGIG